MASTIARIAGKPAKFAWRKPMTIEPVRAVFHLDPDAALVGVLRSAIQFQALQAGFQAETCAEIGTACEDLCRETASKLTDQNSGFDVSIDTFADRIEVSILHPGQLELLDRLEAFSYGDAPAEGTAALSGLKLLSRVDRVLYKIEDGKVRTTLVKFLKPEK
jgi:hypothetical protein